MSAIEVQVEQIAKQESPIMGARYISAVALSWLLYDHLLHIDDEVRDIWSNFGQRPILKLLFLFSRYSTIACVAHLAIGYGSFYTKMEPQDCQNLVIVTAIFTQVIFIGTEGIIIYRLRSLWQFNRLITRAIVIMVTIVFISAVVSVSLEAFEVKDLVHPLPGLRGCFFVSSSSKPFACMVVMSLVWVIWDIFNICIFTCNTFATPYLCSSDILKRFQRDGGRYFFYLLIVQCLCLFTQVFGGNSRLSAIPLVIALTTVINARIFHGIAMEVEQYADEYNITLLKTTSR